MTYIILVMLALSSLTLFCAAPFAFTVGLLLTVCGAGIFAVPFFTWAMAAAWIKAGDNIVASVSRAMEKVDAIVYRKRPDNAPFKLTKKFVPGKGWRD